MLCDMAILSVAGVALTLLGFGVIVVAHRRWGTNFNEDKAPFYNTGISLLQTALTVAGLVFVGLQGVELRRSVESNTVQSLVDSHRALAAMVVDDPSLIEAILPSAENKSDGRNNHPAAHNHKLNMYRSMLFNHAFSAFTLHQHGHVDEDWWSGIVLNMKEVLSVEAMRVHWKATRKTYTEAFQKFIDNKIHK